MTSISTSAVFRMVPAGAAPNTATWTVSIPSAASYRVYARWTAHPNRAINAVYTVNSTIGATNVSVNQQQSVATWNLLGTSDFPTVEVWTGKGLVTHYLLFVISLADRVVEVLGVTTKPDEWWMLQQGRSLVDRESGALGGKRYLIIDRDTKYTAQFRRLVQEAGTEVIRLPPRSPNLNAYAEHFVRSIQDECVNRMIFVGQASLRRAVSDYMAHYYEERNHQGLDNRLIRQNPSIISPDGHVTRRSRLGGTLNFYHRDAAY